jgi:microcystin-dependent protein
MCEPFLGEIKLCAFNYAPQGWALCNGALLPVAQNQALNALLGSTYGGDGLTTVGLPDLQGRTPVHRDYRNSAYSQGVKGGVEAVTLGATNIPAHTHDFNVATSAGNSKAAIPAGACVLAATTGGRNLYGPATTVAPISSYTCASTGGNVGHNNMQPSLVLNFIIATVGLWPPRD